MSFDLQSVRTYISAEENIPKLLAILFFSLIFPLVAIISELGGFGSLFHGKIILLLLNNIGIYLLLPSCLLLVLYETEGKLGPIFITLVVLALSWFGHELILRQLLADLNTIQYHTMAAPLIRRLIVLMCTAFATMVAIPLLHNNKNKSRNWPVYVFFFATFVMMALWLTLCLDPLMTIIRNS